MVEIDGAFGEGGGQIIRSSLTLSLATGRAFRVFNIRARRPKPGLLRQHLTAIRAAAEIGSADVRGDALGSRDLTFRPGQVRAGDYRFATGSAGSTSLVLQTVLPVLLACDGPSHVTLEGGTHNTFAPPFEFLERAFLPLVGRIGGRVEAVLDRPGFYPAGGGKLRVRIEPIRQAQRLELSERGPIKAIRAQAVVSRLPRHIAERELQPIRRAFSLKPDRATVVEERRSPGPGNVVSIVVESEHVTEVVTAFGRKGVPAEEVAEIAIAEASEYVDAGVPVGRHLADQLLVPLALFRGGDFLTLEPSAHTTTNVETIRRFLSTDVSVTEQAGGCVSIRVGNNSG